jgi:eukaryotic-like serine/threonine-protein kinase
VVAEGQVLQVRYRLDACIAIGGMGEVWQATDLLLDRRVAVKMVRSEHAHDEDGLARFRAEAHYAGSLSHPNIAHVYDYCEAEPPDPGYLVTELVDGPSLARLLDDGPLSPARTMDIIAQAARGLAAAHRTGLIHRDVKPGNLLVNGEGQVKITDFGVAHAAGATVLTQEGVLIGTPAYLAPERAAGAPATPAADLYALGVVAHQCLTGQLPFQGEPLAVVIAHMERGMPPLPSSVPAEVAALVTELTSKDPRARPASAEEVAARAGQLAAAVSGTAVSGTAAAPLSFPAAAATAAAAAAVGGAGAMAGAGAAGAGAGRAAGAMEGPGTLDMPLPGARDRRRGYSRIPGGSVAARAALAVAALGVVGLVSWMLVALPGSPPVHPPSLNPPAGSKHAGTHGASAGHPSVAATQAGTGGDDAVQPKGHGKGAKPHGPAPTPTPTPAPSATPTAPSGTPSPTPTGSATPSPAPSATTDPSPDNPNPTLAD